MTLTDGSAAVAIDGDGEGVEVAGARTVDEFLDLALDRLRSGFERASPTD
ncbi:hypothetical protein ACFPER_04800 [Agromyces aurantiacus]|uniref:Uncharacterized protein n=1 Tax=Agromyces aurantiacus TaxID=165814 RepID=A0ABV9R3E6_9MICO|nr:hypothetical protein [Agromyces aurantiacus]MBM7502777.1 hypothetical protein [Agromyces aurantiacus]